MSAFAQQFTEQLYATKTPEWIAAIFGVISVLFARRNHILLYPAGLISTGIYMWLLSRREAGLYAEALLNAYYFVMTAYGWFHWHRGKDLPPLPITATTKDQRLIVLFLVAVLWPLFWFLLGFTPSTVPLWDSFVSATACAGMWLLAKRKIENWLLLNLSNAAAIPLFYYKGYMVTMLLTIVLFVVACFGYFTWKRLMQATMRRQGLQ